jgi:hypothetical protein
MLMKHIRNIYHITGYITNRKDLLFDYELLKQNIRNENIRRAKIRGEDGESFDFDFENMGFTVFKNSDGSARLCSFATYYILDKDGDCIDTIDIEL